MDDTPIPVIPAKKRKAFDVNLDPAGFFVIEVDNKKQHIRVEHYNNVVKNGKIVSGKLQTVFVGTTAEALSDTIVQQVSHLQPDHYLYLGRELQRAQFALEQKTDYEQGGC